METQEIKQPKKRVAKRVKVSKTDDPSGISLLQGYKIYLIIAIALLILYNQVQISSVLKAAEHTSSSSLSFSASGAGMDLSAVDVTSIKSTAQGIAALFPVSDIKTAQDAIAVMVPTGTPDYGASMGVSFDDPVKSMELMARSYGALDKQLRTDKEKYDRYLSLASEPRGVSCEFCCGVGPIGVTKDGRSRCGCQHHPALLTLTMWLIQNTEYTDAEILREVYKWKTLFFPKNMVGLATQIAGGDSSVLKELPGMVGGC